MVAERVTADDFDHKKTLARLILGNEQADSRQEAQRRQRQIDYKETPACYVREHSDTIYWGVFKLLMAALAGMWFAVAMDAENTAQRAAYTYLEKNRDGDFDDPATAVAMRNARAILRRNIFLGGVCRMFTDNALAERLGQYEGHFFSAFTGAMQQDWVIVVIGITVIGVLAWMLVTALRAVLDRRVWQGEKLAK